MLLYVLYTCRYFSIYISNKEQNSLSCNVFTPLRRCLSVACVDCRLDKEQNKKEPRAMYLNTSSQKKLIAFRYNPELLRDLEARFKKNRSETIAYCISKVYSAEFETPLQDLDKSPPASPNENGINLDKTSQRHLKEIMGLTGKTEDEILAAALKVLHHTIGIERMFSKNAY